MSDMFDFNEDDFEDEFEDDFDNEEDEIVEDTGEKKVEETSKSSQSGGKKVIKILMYILVPIVAIAALITASVVSYQFGVSNAKPEIKQVESIKKQSTILENLESVKDSQLAAQANEIAEIQSKISSNQDLSSEQKIMMSKLASDSKAAAVIDEFLSHVMSVGPTADEKVVNVTRDEILKLMTKESGVSAAFDILQGPSAAKQVGHVGKRGSISNVFPIRFSEGDITTYLVVTPFVTDTEVVNQVSVVTIKSSLIESYVYVGLIDSVNSDDFAKALGE